MDILILLVTFIAVFIAAFIFSIKFLREKKYKPLIISTVILMAVVFLVGGFIAVCIGALGENHF